MLGLFDVLPDNTSNSVPNEFIYNQGDFSAPPRNLILANVSLSLCALISQESLPQLHGRI